MVPPAQLILHFFATYVLPVVLLQVKWLRQQPSNIYQSRDHNRQSRSKRSIRTTNAIVHPHVSFLETRQA